MGRPGQQRRVLRFREDVAVTDSKLWDVCAWVGIVTLTVLSLRVAHAVLVSFIVARIGWTQLDEVGFWQAIPAALNLT